MYKIYIFFRDNRINLDVFLLKRFHNLPSAGRLSYARTSLFPQERARSQALPSARLPSRRPPPAATKRGEGNRKVASKFLPVARTKL
jgi:hypothetical protein